MTNSPQDRPSPFETATTTNRRLKLFLWGDTGVGKTTLALRFPHPVVIDMEGGTEHYGGDFEFDVLKATTADEVIAAVDWLLVHPHEYRTLVIDPITVFWDALQSKWRAIFLRRNRGGKGHNGEYYTLQPKDWVTLKYEFKDLLRKLIRLDMNVIVTARQKAQYADTGFMRVIGETFDGEKSLPYLFDTILHLYRDDGRFMAENIKDRTNKLPHGHFKVSYEEIERCLGADSLAREAIPLSLATPNQVEHIRQFVADSGMKKETLQRRLAVYDARSIEGLTEENAQIIIDKFTAAAEDKPAATPTSPKEEDHA
ncbi:ATP-binding protein [bacterium]|nr:ATP-binding protein [bacterium]MBU1677140.1 ATP-binding protein [bacterium]